MVLVKLKHRRVRLRAGGSQVSSPEGGTSPQRAPLEMLDGGRSRGGGGGGPSAEWQGPGASPGGRRAFPRGFPALTPELPSPPHPCGLLLGRSLRSRPLPCVPGALLLGLRQGSLCTRRETVPPPPRLVDDPASLLVSRFSNRRHLLCAASHV